MGSRCVNRKAPRKRRPFFMLFIFTSKNETTVPINLRQDKPPQSRGIKHPLHESAPGDPPRLLTHEPHEIIKRLL